MENEVAASLHLESEAMKDENKKLPRCDNDDNSAAMLIGKHDKHGIQNVDGRCNGRGDPTEEKDSVQSPAAAPAIALESQCQKLDRKDLDDSDPHGSIILNESCLEVNVSTGVELSVGSGTKEMDMNSCFTPAESSSVFGAIERNLAGEEAKELVSLDNVTNKELASASAEMEVEPTKEVEEDFVNPEQNARPESETKTVSSMVLLDKNLVLETESETEENQAAFMKELEAFHKERCLEFKPPKFYGEPLNCLKLWRAVVKLGGYEQVTACKLWRQVGESFNPPKTCTTVSWTFRGFYEKVLLEYEKHKMRSGELPFTDASFAEASSMGNQAGLNQASGSGRARRDAAARAMQGWHSQRLLGNGEVGDPIIKDKTSVSTPKREKQLKTVGLLKRKKLSPADHPLQVERLKAAKPQLESMVVDIGPPADWVKINVQRTKDCFEVYALVPGLLREEVRVQSDPAGRLVISGQPEQLDNPWGVTPFKKVVSLPSRIDPHQTSAVVTLHGQLFVRVPFEQSDM